jgi:hypothetical protein
VRTSSFIELINVLRVLGEDNILFPLFRIFENRAGTVRLLSKTIVFLGQLCKELNIVLCQIWVRLVLKTHLNVIRALNKIYSPWSFTILLKKYFIHILIKKLKYPNVMNFQLPHMISSYLYVGIQFSVKTN